MSDFWEDVKAASGPNTLGSITFEGSFNSIGNNYNLPGRKEAVAVKTADGYVIRMKKRDDWPLDVKEVYWLPWKSYDCAEVEMRVLMASPCEYFLTSMLSGCRFVVTDTLVSHISCLQKTKDGDVDSSFARDGKDHSLLPEHFRGRRKMSISSYVEPSDHTYDNQGERHAFVIGYREFGKWHFKWLQLDEGDSNGTWTIFI